MIKPIISVTMQLLTPFSEMDMSSIFLRLVAIVLVYHSIKILYNISPFHPLSAIPGPKLAAASYLPEFWHDAVRFGRYTHEIRKMHDKYGMSHDKIRMAS